LFWETESWRFAGWYINMQSPFVRTAIGFDTSDNILDVWVEPDGTSSWKDDGELDEAVRAGAFGADAAATIRRQATRAVASIRGREPFTEEWTRWRPDGAWPIPGLHPDWESVSFIVGYRFVMRRRYDPSTTQDYPSWVWFLRSSSARRKA
jgi:hypothetical protein